MPPRFLVFENFNCVWLDPMAHHCSKCKKDVSSVVGTNASLGRKEACPHCSTDLHVCLNCVHYDKTAYNECHEPQAERVLEKDLSNFCDYFKFRSGMASAGGQPSKKDTLKKLDDLFK